MNRLVEKGVTWKGLEAYSLIAINIPKNVDLPVIQGYLQKMEDDDVLCF